jgi:hypothetical protein
VLLLLLLLLLLTHTSMGSPGAVQQVWVHVY